MPAIIGGSPSTGSSVLVNILNRHSEIAAGPETHLFTKPNLYHDWKRYKYKILKPGMNGLKSPGIHRFNGVIINQNQTLRGLLERSNSFQEFADFYLLHDKKRLWVEKTPANSYCFDLFLDQFENAKVILVVRNPYDAVASMHARGIPIAKASALYLANITANIHLREAKNFNIVKYEKLVKRPHETLTEICKFLDVKFESQMLNPDPGIEKMTGWKQNEKAALGKKSLNRFSDLEESEQNKIKAALQSIKLVSKSWPFTNVMIKDIRDICALNDYDYLEFDGMHRQPSILSEKLLSTIKYYPTKLTNYPVTFT